MTAKRLLLFTWCSWLMLLALVVAQEGNRPLSVEDIEYLLREGVTPRRVVTLVEEYGVKFEVTREVREQLRRTGAGEEVVRAVERAEAEFMRSQRLTGLLAQARRQVVAERLISPAGNNALETYREILRIVPGHQEALDGVREMTEQSIRSAEAAQQREEWAKAQEYYENALTIDPEDSALVAALRQVRERRKAEDENPPKTTGKDTRGWLGVSIQSVTPELAKSFNLKEPVGALVAEVTKGV
jgi:tetratricopeptide (TPR) repeat protein